MIKGERIMSDTTTVKLTIRAFEFGTKDAANVLIRVADTKNIVGVFRCNPVSVDLPPGNYGVYVSGDDYDTALKGDQRQLFFPGNDN